MRLMTESSLEYAKLERALAEAKSLLLGLPDHDVSDKVHVLKLKSYIILCHAAIEEYLEDVSLYILKTCLLNFGQTKQISDVVYSACTYYGVGRKDYCGVRPSGFNFSDDFYRLAQASLAAHEAALISNHGIKTVDQDSIMMPIGVRIHSYDHVLSQALNSLGELRGGFAHSYGIKAVLPKVAVIQKIDYLNLKLMSLDGFLTSRLNVLVS